MHTAGRLMATLLLPALLACDRAVEPASEPSPASELPATVEVHLPPDYQRENAPWLTHREAMLRAQSVSNIVYRLAIDLTTADLYSAEVEIEFDYQPTDYPLSLDFLEGTVEAIHAADASLPVNYNGNYISIDPGHLAVGRNVIRIKYSSAYSRTGSGLYRFVDSVDGRVYLYTHFEPFDANRLVPSFDQPNLRARWLLQARVPEDWVVISSVTEEKIEQQDGFATWYFPESAEISSYIFPLHAGQYHSWEGQAGDIPLRLFARESLAPHVRAEWMLDLTAAGMAYYQDYFDEPYPFKKYDQVIVPDFNIGGMENVAAVTYTEDYVPRGDPTRQRLQAIGSTFLHELSHMWFGDLVTIDWWNALWLKESFASIMDPLAIDNATDFEDAWLTFYLSDKQHAYTADQRVTTHPIEMPVRDTKSGDASFDRITYQKGASVLKQLNHFLGEDVFREGVRLYMDRYAWKAAVLPNFMDTLAEVSGRDLSAWSHDWLETAGLNTVQADYQCDSGMVTSFSLLQSAPDDYPTLRTHRLQTGLYQLVDGKVQAQRIISIELSGARTELPEFIGEICPLLVYPNVADWGYIKAKLDSNTLQHVPENLNNISDPLLRSMFWFSLWDSVRDVDMPIGDFIEIALEHLSSETSASVLEKLLAKLVAAKNYLYLFGSNATELQRQYLPAMESMARRGVLANEAGSDSQKQWFDAWLKLAVTAGSTAEIEAWINGAAEPRALNQDQDRRWNALIALSRLGYTGVKALQDLEIDRDATAGGAEKLLRTQSAWPDVNSKSGFLDLIDDVDNGVPAADLKATLYTMFLPGQVLQHGELADRILESLPRLDIVRDQDFIDDYVEYILPNLCTAESVDRLAMSIQDRGSLGLIATKALQVAHQEDQRCVAMAAKQLRTLSPQ